MLFCIACSRMMEDSRAAKVKEAQRLRNLGFYNDAVRRYEEAEAERSDILLATELASTFLEQGRVQTAFDKIQQARDAFHDSIDDDSVLALAQLLEAFATAFKTGQFTPALKACGHVYDQLLRDRPLEEFSKRLVSPMSRYSSDPASASGGLDSLAVVNSMPTMGLYKYNAL